MTDGGIGYERGVPDPVRVIFAARWLKGAASIAWLVAHPDWWEWVDICSTAQQQAEAEKSKQEA